MLKLFKRSSAMRKTIIRTYDQKVINYFENPPNVGTLDRNASNVGTGNNLFLIYTLNLKNLIKIKIIMS